MSALRGLRRNQQDLASAQRRIATGRRIETLSDDPAGSVDSMRLSSQLADIDQFVRNGQIAGTRLATEEAALAAIEKILTEARRIANEASSLDSSDPGRQAAATTLAELRRQVISIANTKIGNEYLFGGTRTDRPPFDEAGTYQGSGEPRRIEINDGELVETDIPGDQIFSVMIDALGGLVTAVESGDSGSITRAAGGLDPAAVNLGQAQVQIGLRQRQVEEVGQRLAAQSGRLVERRETLVNADPIESTVNMVAAQNALERAYAAVSRVIETSILPYLK